jgi:molybdopterin converting factor small subunit
MVHVRLYSTLRKYYPDGNDQGPLQIVYIRGMKTKDLMNVLGINEDREVSLIAVNGELKGLDFRYPIQDGDRVDLYGFVSGG